MQRLFNSVRHAWHGLIFLVREERNFSLHLVMAVIAVCIALILDFLLWEFALLIFAIGLVLLMEIVNTVSEKLIDIAKPRIHFYAGMVKDMMAAAVLIAVLVAIIIGMMLFIPHIRLLF